MSFKTYIFYRYYRSLSSASYESQFASFTTCFYACACGWICYIYTDFEQNLAWVASSSTACLLHGGFTAFSMKYLLCMCKKHGWDLGCLFIHGILSSKFWSRLRYPQLERGVKLSQLTSNTFKLKMFFPTCKKTSWVLSVPWQNYSNLKASHAGNVAVAEYLHSRGEQLLPAGNLLGYSPQWAESPSNFQRYYPKRCLVAGHFTCLFIRTLFVAPYYRDAMPPNKCTFGFLCSILSVI